MFPMFLSSLLLVSGVLSVTQVACPERAPTERIIEYVESWRTDPSSDEYLLGNVQSAAMDDLGNLYLLDTQLQSLSKFSDDGEFLGVLARQGMGPGEIQTAWTVEWWSPNSLVLLQPFPSQVLRISTEGKPQEDLEVFRDPNQETPSLLTAFEAAGRLALVEGSQLMLGVATGSQDFWTGVVDRDGQLLSSLDSYSIPLGTPASMNEADKFRSWERSCISESGRIFVAPEREHYLIQEYDSTLQMRAEWKRPYEARRRTKAELAQLRDQSEKLGTFLPTSPPIASVEAFEGELWVFLDQAPDSAHFARVAVHTLDGRLETELLLEFPFDPLHDIARVLSPEHVVVFENAVDAQIAEMGGDPDATAAPEEPEPLEVVLYRAQP